MSGPQWAIFRSLHLEQRFRTGDLDHGLVCDWRPAARSCQVPSVTI
jgi:hypothetical protein